MDPGVQDSLRESLLGHAISYSGKSFYEKDTRLLQMM